MFTRLRQRADMPTATIYGFIRQVGGSYAQALTFPPLLKGGTLQVVADDFISKRHFSKNKTDVPPLHEVQMSKIRFIVPQDELVTYTAASSSWSFDFGGTSLAGHPFTSGSLPLEFQTPTNVYILPFTQVQPEVASYLLQRAYSRASSAEYDFGPTVGEIAETASMLASPLRSIAKLSSLAFAGCKGIYKDGARVAVKVAKNATSKQLRVLRKATVEHPTHSSLRLVDESANHWLAYKFGVLPFVDDVGKILDFAKENVDPHFGLQVARVKGRKTDTSSSVFMNNQVLYQIPTYNQLAYNLFAVKRVEDRHTCGLYWRNRINAPIVNFLENIGLSPFQLPSLAYELIPLSFVVDRFIDIKSFVRGNIGSLSKDTFGNYVTRKISTVYSYHLSDVRFGDMIYKAKVSQELNSVAHMEQMARSINTERPTFPVVNPYWRDQLTADATNLSLIWGRLRTFVGKL